MVKIKYWIVLFVVVYSIVFVSALGVSPGKVELEFTPNLEHIFDMNIFNTLAQKTDAEVYVYLLTLNESVRDEFNNVVSLEKTALSFTESDAQKLVKVTLKFPEGFSKGGLHELRVGVAPVIQGGEGLAVRAGNEIRVLVNVADQYVNEKYRIIKTLKIISVSAESVEQGKDSKIAITVKSESPVVLSDVYARITISKDGQIIGNLQTEKTSVNAGEEKVLSSVFNTGSYSGDLLLDVEVFYGSESVKEKGVLSIRSGPASGGIEISSKSSSFLWLWILIIVIIVISIGFILFFLLRRKKDSEIQPSPSS